MVELLQLIQYSVLPLGLTTCLHKRLNVITAQVGSGSPIHLTYWIEPSGLYIIYCSRVGGALTGNFMKLNL